MPSSPQAHHQQGAEQKLPISQAIRRTKPYTETRLRERLVLF